MIKVFSIEEIVKASNNILNDNRDNKEETLDNKKITKEAETHSNSEQKNRDLQEPLILTEETIQTKKRRHLKILPIKEKKIIDQNNEVISEIYHLLNKKIRKSTIKVILDQQLEINSLKENISNLRKKDFRNLKINKQLKEEIATLLNNEKILNFKFKKFQEKLNEASIKEKELIDSNSY